MGMALAVLVFLFGLAWATSNHIDPASGRGGVPDLQVTGRQWFWQARYPRSSNPGAPTSSTISGSRSGGGSGQTALRTLLERDFPVPSDAILPQQNRL